MQAAEEQVDEVGMDELLDDMDEPVEGLMDITDRAAQVTRHPRILDEVEDDADTEV